MVTAGIIMEPAMKIYVTSVFVDDQSRARSFYAATLGFVVKHDIPMGAHRWLTVTSPDAPDGPELLLEPSTHPAVMPYRAALLADGIPAHSFQVDDLAAEHARLTSLGVVFTQDPTDAGATRMAVFDDTCGNLIQLVQML